MAKPISKPTEATYKLDSWDPSGETFITVRQATQQAHEAMSDLYSEISRVVRNEGGPVEIRTRVSQQEVQRRAVFLTMVDCNLTMDDTPEKLLFKFRKAPNGRTYLDMTEVAFADLAWGLLPIELASELFGKVLELNPQWGSAGE